MKGNVGAMMDEIAAGNDDSTRREGGNSFDQAGMPKPAKLQDLLRWEARREQQQRCRPDSKFGNNSNSSKDSVMASVSTGLCHGDDPRRQLKGHHGSQRWAQEFRSHDVATSEAADVKLQESRERTNEGARIKAVVDHQWQIDYDRLKEHVESLEAQKKELQQKLSKMELEYSKLSESGSYTQDSATPTEVSMAFSKIFHAVYAFSTRLAKLVPEHKKNDMKGKYEKVSKFLKASHFPALTLTAEVVNILFESFENESFIEGGYSVYLDPVKRKEEFFAMFRDFKNHLVGSGNASRDESHEEFVQYYRRCKTRVVEAFGTEDSTVELDRLDLEFGKAVQNVWALHLLCFSFDPPASIFRVRAGAKFEQKYMEPPQNLEVEEHLLKKVAFMLTPGLRIDKFSTIKCVIYPVFEESIDMNIE